MTSSIDASEAGDVVRVVSLLNSGADVNTVGGLVYVIVTQCKC